MPSKSSQQRKWIFTQRGKYKSKDNTPEDMKWIWEKDWEVIEERNMKRYERKFEEEFNKSDYLKWKKKNVTYRGMKTIGKDNQVYGSWGKGLYTVPLSNKSMAKQYGKLYFVVGAIPKKPMIVQSVNSAEIARQQMIIDFCKSKGHDRDYDPSFFEKHTSMDKELIKQGYDGFVIKGREMVNYTPSTDIKYFETEEDLIDYYETI